MTGEVRNVAPGTLQNNRVVPQTEERKFSFWDGKKLSTIILQVPQGVDIPSAGNKEKLIEYCTKHNIPYTEDNPSKNVDIPLGKPAQTSNTEAVQKTETITNTDPIVNDTGRYYAEVAKTEAAETDLNPDAGAGSAVVVKENKKTTVNLSDIPPEIRTQSPFKELLGAGDKGGNYEIKPENYDKLKEAIEKYYSTPNSIDIAGSDAEFNAQIKQVLQTMGVYDEAGNVKDPQKLAEITKNGITVNGKKYTFKAEDGEQIGIEVTQTTHTVVSSKFKEMDPATVKKIKSEQLKELEKQGFVTKVGDTYYTTQTNLQAKGASEIGSTTKIKPVDLVGNKSLQDVREKELQQDFLKAYDTDPDNAFDALLHTKYYKEYKKLEDSLHELNGKDMSNSKKKDYGNEVEYRRKGTLARAYFAQSKNMDDEIGFEYATEADLKKFNNDVNSKIEELKKASAQDRLDRYKTAFGDVNSTNIDDLSDEQLLELAQNEVYASGLTDAQIKHMASIQFKNRFNTKMNNVYNDYQEKIATARAKGKDKKATKLQTELQEKLQEISQQKIETENKDRGDYAAMMARGQLNSEIGEGNFTKTNPTYASIIAQVPQAETFIQANKDIFFKKDDSGQEVFNAQAWKDFWLNQSLSRRDNTVAADNHRVKDYYMTLGEAQNVVRGNEKGRANEKFIGLGQVYSNLSENERINLARDMAESAGIVTEKNKTAGIRAAYVLGETAKGAGVAAAADILANTVLSKIKIPYSGTVPYAQSGVIQDFDKFVTKNYSNGKLVNTVETNVLEEHKWEVNDNVDYSGSEKIKEWKLDPWAIGVGGAAGLIKGLVGMKKKHDKQDGKSEVQMYARDNYNRRTLSTPETVVNASDPITTKKFVAQLAEDTRQNEPINNRTHKMVVKRGGVEKTGPNSGKAYNLAEDKADYVSKLYGVKQGTPEFNKLYKYIMETINGVKQYKPHQFKNDKTYYFPETLPKEITGLDNDYKAGAEPPKKFIKIYLANGVKTNITGKAKQLQGSTGKSVNATLTASHKRKVK